MMDELYELFHRRGEIFLFFIYHVQVPPAGVFSQMKDEERAVFFLLCHGKSGHDGDAQPFSDERLYHFLVIHLCHYIELRHGNVHPFQKAGGFFSRAGFLFAEYDRFLHEPLQTDMFLVELPVIVIGGGGDDELISGKGEKGIVGETDFCSHKSKIQIVFLHALNDAHTVGLPELKLKDRISLFEDRQHIGKQVEGGDGGGAQPDDALSQSAEMLVNAAAKL